MEIVAPEDIGFSSKRLERVNSAMQGYVDSGRLAGIVTMLARDGKTFHFERFGVSDLKTRKPMEEDTIFRIYSMTKPITSVAAMMLYEEGRFGLDDSVSRFIPELDNLKVCIGMGQAGPKLIPQERPITVRQLLSHTSGLSYGANQDSPVEAMYREAKPMDPASNLEETAQKLGKLPLAYQPGRGWRYSVSTDVLGYLVQVVSGQRFDQFLQERILGPLGMEDTAFYTPEDKLDRFARVYGPSERGLAELNDERTQMRYQPPVTFFSGGGGLVSTASDYMRFCQMLLNGGELDGVRLLGPKTIEMMTEPHLTDEQLEYAANTAGPEQFQGSSFGLGFKVVTSVAETGVLGSEGTFSWGGAASTIFWIDPVEDLVAILMTQFMPSSQYQLRRDFQIATYQALVE
ncbi:MAG: beta-lactamase family protein [Chloroflexi bacterium]|nr:beta-lactamase family protein [Chloroflexota bacterium]